MRKTALLWPAVLCGGLLVGCSEITLLRTQELRDVRDSLAVQIHTTQKQVADVQKSVDDLNLKQGGSTSKMRADLTSMLSDLQTQIQQLHSDIDATQYRLNQLSQKLDRLDQRKIVVSPEGSGAAADTAQAANGAAPAVKLVNGLDLNNLYSQARDDYVRGKYSLAYDGFKTVYEKDDSTGSYRELAEFWMAECLFQGQKVDRALEMYQRVIQEFPQGTKTCAARFKIGLIFDKQKDVEKRNGAWQELISECPQSNEAERARAIMNP